MVGIDDSAGVTKCWLSLRDGNDELAQLERAAAERGWQREIAIQLMGRCGLRVSEVNYPADTHLRWSEEGECWRLEVRGKNTRGGEKTIRDAWMPDDVQSNVRRFARERGRADGEPWVQRHKDTVRQWVRDAAEDVAEESDQPERWRAVSSHDLRRSWATHHLVERGVDVRTMMAIGGWSDYAAIEPYLDQPTDARVGEAMRGEREAPTVGGRGGRGGRRY